MEVNEHSQDVVAMEKTNKQNPQQNKYKQTKMWVILFLWHIAVNAPEMYINLRQGGCV